MAQGSVDATGSGWPEGRTPHKKTSESTQAAARQYTVTLSIVATPPKVGAGDVVKWERLEDPFFWTNVLTPGGKRGYGDPSLTCAGVSVEEREDAV